MKNEALNQKMHVEVLKNRVEAKDAVRELMWVHGSRAVVRALAEDLDDEALERVITSLRKWQAEKKNG